MLIW
jgi:hypothetical protein